MWNLALLAILAKGTLAFSSFGELKSNHIGKVIDLKYLVKVRKSQNLASILPKKRFALISALTSKIG